MSLVFPFSIISTCMILEGESGKLFLEHLKSPFHKYIAKTTKGHLGHLAIFLTFNLTKIKFIHIYL